MRSCVFSLVLLFTVHLLHAEDITATSSMNTTEAHNNSNSGNVTCGENQEYCEDTQSCTKTYHKCNGCSTFEVLCPDGRCVNLAFHIHQGCSHCGFGEHECPNGKCYDNLISNYYRVCPGCDNDQVTCPDGLCAERRENCTSCPEGKRRCADKKCIPKNELCKTPCFSGQVYCADEYVCRDNYLDCECYPDSVPCPSGACKYKSCSGYTDDDDDSGTNPMVWVGVLGLLFALIPLYLALKHKQRIRARQQHTVSAVELQPVPTARPTMQNTPSHFPVPPSVNTAVPQAQYMPPTPNMQTPLIQPPPPSYESATQPPPPSYNDVCQIAPMSEGQCEQNGQTDGNG